MKNKLCAIVGAAMLASCNSGWHQENKDAFYEACMDDARTWVADPAKQKLYCDCVMIHVMDKYPDVNDALEHIEELAKDPDIQVCKTPIMK